jgi:hypothetical protein
MALSPEQSPEEKNKQKINWGQKYMFLNLHCTYIGMCVSEFEEKNFQDVPKIFQTLSG